MKDSRQISKIIALMLVVVMSITAFAGCIQSGNNSGDIPNGPNHTCVFGEWDIVKSATETEDGLKERKCECGEVEQEVIKAYGTDEHTCIFGEWTIVKAPTNTEDGLRERRCECGKADQEVIKASGGEFAIYYDNLKTADYPEQTGYNSNDGLLSLPKPVADGYNFIGWFTASIGGDIVDYIPKGSTQDYVLYAHWELITYDIAYKNVPNNTNPTTYNIESKLKLENPKWSGLVFTHWSDEDGNKYAPDENITQLPMNTSGDLTLTANWKVLRNIATPADKGAKLYNAFSGEEGMIYFYYDLGTIEHIVLDSIHPDMYYKYEGMPLNLALSKTVSVSEETAESVSKTISTSISKTVTFSSAHNWANENSLSTKTDVSISSSSGKLLPVEIAAESTFGVEGTDSSSRGYSSSTDVSSGSTSETSKTVVSSLNYKKEMTSEITENISIDATLPSGYYAYVHAGNIRVIGIVTYEISTGNYYLNTYSMIDNMHSMIMYYPDVNSMNNPDVEGLDFNIPEDEIVNFVENVYYVKYDANDGEGTMPITLHSVDGSERLAINTCTKEDSIFVGWELVTNDGTKLYLDGQTVTNLGDAHEIVTLKAVWKDAPDTVYTVTTKSGHITKVFRVSLLRLGTLP